MLKDEPSTVMLFIRLSAPAKLLPLDCGVRRVTSLILPFSVGMRAISARPTDVAAPVRLELKTGSTLAVTVTSSCTAMAVTVNDRSDDDAEVDGDVFLGLRREGRAADVRRRRP